MHFCKECGNMYYLKLKNIENNSSNNLVYYCRKCGNEDENILENKNNLYVSKNELKVKSNYKNIINKYTKLDPTIPRIYTIDCPNSECPSNKHLEEKKGETVDKEILYIKYDNANMKFIYLCAVCDKIWNIN
tara:strand:+ start:8498 stop:8893 length:396 start_codon:yes stop_codon:yes gene_type:complete